MQPRIKFFCELNIKDLKKLLFDEEITKTLIDLHAGLCVGLVDLSNERAEIIQYLNQIGIPVTAWLLLPEEDGYWINLDNQPKTLNRYLMFKQWAIEHKLIFDSIGFKTEPDLQTIQALLQKRISILGPLLMRVLRPGRYNRESHLYKQLAEQIRMDGYSIEAYHIPLIIDDRLAKSKIVRRMLGLIDISAEKEVMMLYSSFVRPWGPGFIWSYGKDAEAIAVGSTGGGIDLNYHEKIVPLTWEELEADLRIAYRWCNSIYIFSLEGCVAQNYLSKIKSLEWDHPILEPNFLINNLDRKRLWFQASLWGITHLSIFLILGIALILLIRIKRRLL